MQLQDVFYDAAADDAAADDAAADDTSPEPPALALLDMLLKVPQLLMACSCAALKQLRLVCKPFCVATTAEIKTMVVNLDEPAFMEALSRLPGFLKGSGCHLRCFGVILPFTCCSAGDLLLRYPIPHLFGSDIYVIGYHT